MELRTYLRMLRRGWLTILLTTMLGVTLSSLYVTTTPAQYDSSAVLFISTNAPVSVDDLAQGASFATNAAVTYAQIIDSSTVLGPVAAELGSQQDVDELVGAVTTSVREETTLIDISVSSGDPRTAAQIANTTADTAVRLIPQLQLSPDGRPLVGLQKIRAAVEPSDAGSPDMPRLLAVGLLAGLFVGVGGTIVQQSLDSRIHRSDDLARLTEIPVVAVLPGGPREGPQALAARLQPTSALGEAFRMLRTNLGGAVREPRSIVVASVDSDRDGAWTAANLAWTVAAAGQRVLLVDADPRASAVGDIFGLEAGPGLAEALTARASPAVVHSTGSPLLSIMLPGTTQSAPSDLLSAPSLGRLLRRLESEHDLVLVHVPSVLSFADAAVVASASGGTFVVVGAGRTRADEVTSALGTFANVRVRPLGIVLVGAGPGDRPRRTRVEITPSRPVTPAHPDLDSPTLRHHPANPASARPPDDGVGIPGNGVGVPGNGLRPHPPTPSRREAAPPPG